MAASSRTPTQRTQARNQTTVGARSPDSAHEISKNLIAEYTEVTTNGHCHTSQGQSSQPCDARGDVVKPSSDLTAHIEDRDHVFTEKPNRIHKNVLRDGYIIIEGCTSRIGIPSMRLNLKQATKLTSHLFSFQAPCACGTYTLVANFCLDEIKCQGCDKLMALPGGDRTKLTEHAMDSMTCQDCNYKYMWTTEFDIKHIMHLAGFRKSQQPAIPPDNVRIHKRKNIHDEELFPFCSNPKCTFAMSGKSDDVDMVKYQLECSTGLVDWTGDKGCWPDSLDPAEWRAAGLIALTGDVTEALLLDYDSQLTNIRSD